MLTNPSTDSANEAEVVPYLRTQRGPLYARNLHELVAEQASRTPNEVAAMFGEELLSYRELDDRSNRLATALVSQGIIEGSRVAIMLDRSLDLPLVVMALLKCGAACVPLDPSYPPERLAFMLEDSEPAMILTVQALRDQVPDTRVPVFDVAMLMNSCVSSDPVQERKGNLEAPVYILYTSGSTGHPKGVIMPHHPLVNLVDWHQRVMPVQTGERVLQFAPLSFDVSFQELFTTWCGGGTLVLMADALRRDPEGLLEILVEQRIQRLFLPFVALQQLAEAAVAAECFPSTLRDVITAGEQLQISEAIRVLFQHLPHVRLHNQYGPTETHVATAFTLPDDPVDWPHLPPIGRAIDQTTVHLLDEEKKPVPPGSAGEIYLSGACVSQGYWNRSELTSLRFLQDPGNPSRRMYRTGDLGRQREDGELEFLGRADDQIKIRGHRVEPGEIEAVLRAHPAVADCAVVARNRGDGIFLAAYWLARPETRAASAELRSFLQSRLPEPMVPALYIQLERLPLTPSGKLDRRALPEGRHMEPLDIPRRDMLSDGLEQAIGSVWQEVLEVDEVGPLDHFFEIGGNSLLVARVQRRLRTVLNREIPITDLFQYVTVRQLAAHFANIPDASRGREVDPAVRAARQREALAKRRAQMRAFKD